MEFGLSDEQILLQDKLITQRQLDRTLKHQTVLRKAVIVAALSFAPLSFVQAEDAEPVSDSHHSRALDQQSNDYLATAGKWLPDGYQPISDEFGRPLNGANSLSAAGTPEAAGLS